MRLFAARLWTTKLIFKEPLNMEQIHCTLAMPQEVPFVADNFIIHMFLSLKCQHLAI